MVRFFLLLMLAGPVAAETLTDGANAYAAGNYAAARAALRPLADRGSAVAETLLGVMAARGDGRVADPAAAAGWWLRAANRGYGPARLALAKALATGHGVATDKGRAWVWARLAMDDAAVTSDARAMAAQLGAGMTAPELAKLEVQREQWHPWR